VKTKFVIAQAILLALITFLSLDIRLTPTSRLAASALGVVDNLKKTRDALLDQKAQLSAKADVVYRKIKDSQREYDLLQAAITDTDRSIKDIDDALGAR
jgi:septal ring factor EnvC (AmiA/AmiB activator)